MAFCVCHNQAWPEFRIPQSLAFRRQQLFWWNVTHSSLWWSHHVLLIEIRNVDFAISSLYYQSSPIVGTSSTFSISLGATTFHFFTHFKMICTKFPRPSGYFFLYKFYATGMNLHVYHLKKIKQLCLSNRLFLSIQQIWSLF